MTTGTALRFLGGILLIVTSWFLIGITGFNAAYIFSDPGIVDARTHGLLEWLAYVYSHFDEFRKALGSDSGLLHETNLPEALFFIFPAIAILASWRAKGLQLAILIILCFVTLVDLSILLQFDGSNSANGGDDGLGCLLAMLIHDVVGAITMFMATIGFVISVVRFRKSAIHARAV